MEKRGPAVRTGAAGEFTRSLLVQGHNYRVAATMRTSKASGVPTRKVRIQQPYIIR